MADCLTTIGNAIARRELPPAGDTSAVVLQPQPANTIRAVDGVR